MLLAAAAGGDMVTYAANAYVGKLPGLLADNATHAALAGLCWWAVVAGGGSAGAEREQDHNDNNDSGSSGSNSKRQRMKEVAAAACAGSLLDLDHFLAARSTHLGDALSLPQRPVGHCLTTLLLGTGVVYLLLRMARAGACCCLASCRCPRHSREQQQSLTCRPPASAPLRWAALLGTATLSHQLRDAVRRGLWLCPLHYSTPAVPYPLYLCLLALLPIAVRWLLARASAASASAHSSASALYRRARAGEWEAEWGDLESEEEEDGDEGVELPVVIV